MILFFKRVGDYFVMINVLIKEFMFYFVNGSVLVVEEVEK